MNGKSPLKEHQYIPNLSSNISIIDFFDEINYNLSIGLLNRADFGAFILKIKKILQIIIDENKKDYQLTIESLSEAVRKQEEFGHLGVDVQVYNTTKWVDYNQIGDEELVKLYELQKEIQERIDARQAYWKEIAENQAKPKFGISRQKTLTVPAQVPVLRTVEKEIVAVIPDIHVKHNVKIII